MLMFFIVCFFHVFHYTLKNMFFNVFSFVNQCFIIYGLFGTRNCPGFGVYSSLAGLRRENL